MLGFAALGQVALGQVQFEPGQLPFYTGLSRGEIVLTDGLDEVERELRRKINLRRDERWQEEVARSVNLRKTYQKAEREGYKSLFTRPAPPNIKRLNRAERRQQAAAISRNLSEHLSKRGQAPFRGIDQAIAAVMKKRPGNANAILVGEVIKKRKRPMPDQTIIRVRKMKDGM